MQAKELKLNPFQQFKQWYAQAGSAGEADVEAMALSTSSSKGFPSVRFVLLKGVDNSGFLFYTNYTSRKGEELAENPLAAIAFYWPKAYKQIRIEGKVEKLTVEESARYFKTRERDSQLGAWASKQSTVIENRDSLLSRFNQKAEEFANSEVPCPEFWGGYRLIPSVFEFWEGRAHRLSDRFRYVFKEGSWCIERLSP